MIVRLYPEQEVSPGGVILPECARETTQKGVVEAVGPGILLTNGQRVPVGVKKGDHVILAKWAGTQFEDDGEKYVIVWQHDLLAVLKPETTED